MVIINNMVEIETTEVETSGSTGARNSVRYMQKLELMMRMEEGSDNEYKMMFAMTNMGVQWLEWFVDFQEKPEHRKT